MHILYLIDTLAIGGAETSTLALVREIAPHHQVTVATFYGAGPLTEDFRAAGAAVKITDLARPYGFRAGVKVLRSLLREIRPDVVHAALFRSEMIARLALRGSSVPLINTFVNDSYSKLHYDLKASWVGKLKLAGIQAMDRITKGRVDHFTAITHSTAAANCKALGVPEQDVTVIYRGRDTANYADHTYRSESSVKRVTYLTASRLLWRKGYRESLQAVSDLPEDWDVTYLIAGQGVEGRQIREFATTLPNSSRFTFLGQVSDLHAIYPGADYFLMPSHYEGLGGALIEAMLARLPIIASDIPVFREVTGGHARFFPVKCWEDLRTLLHDTIGNSAGDPVEKAYALAQERYSIRRVAEQTVAMYHTVINHKSSGKL